MHRSARVKVEPFMSAVRAGVDGGGLSKRDLSNLRTAFQTMTPTEREQALAQLLVGNFPRTYEAVRELAPIAQSFELDSFKGGVRAAMNDADRLTKRDFANIRDAFSRLTRDDKGRALEFLIAEKLPRTYEAVRDLAGGEVHADFDSFKAGIQAAVGRGMTERDFANARDVFARLSTSDQSRALEYLFTDNLPRSYEAVRDLAGADVHLSFETFQSGLKAARGVDGLDKRDLSNVRDVVGRLSTDDRERAFEFMLTDHWPGTLEAVKDLL
jgi:hypothetical protein